MHICRSYREFRIHLAIELRYVTQIVKSGFICRGERFLKCNCELYILRGRFSNTDGRIQLLRRVMASLFGSDAKEGFNENLQFRVFSPGIANRKLLRLFVRETQKNTDA